MNARSVMSISQGTVITHNTSDPTKSRGSPGSWRDIVANVSGSFKGQNEMPSMMFDASWF
jgi:hypothetical protein